MSDPWVDADGEPLGHWEPCSMEEYNAIIDAHGGREALSVFSSYTNPPEEMYTAWGHREDDAPLVDARMLDCDMSIRDPAQCPGRHIFRRFVLSSPSDSGDTE